MERAEKPPLFGLCLLWPNGRPSQQLLSSCMNIMFILNVLSGMKTSGGKKSLCHLSPQVHFQNKSCTTIGAWRYASLASTTKVSSELPAWLLAAPCQMKTGRCKHFESRWSVASLGVVSTVQLCSGCANRIRLASVNSFIRVTCPNRESMVLDGGGKWRLLSHLTYCIISDSHTSEYH